MGKAEPTPGSLGADPRARILGDPSAVTVGVIVSWGPAGLDRQQAVGDGPIARQRLLECAAAANAKRYALLQSPLTAVLTPLASRALLLLS